MSQQYEMATRTFVDCRHGENIKLPCNWVIQGRCGADSLPCKIENYHEKTVREKVES